MSNNFPTVRQVLNSIPHRGYASIKRQKSIEELAEDNTSLFVEIAWIPLDGAPLFEYGIDDNLMNATIIHLDYARYTVDPREETRWDIFV